MAKKSNKTEHVLRLITKNDEAEQENDFFSIDRDPAHNASHAAHAVIQPVKQAAAQEVAEIKVQKEIHEIVEQPETPEIVEQPETSEVTAQPEPPESAAQQETADAPELKATATLKAFREQEAAGSTVPESGDDLVNLAELLAKEKVGLVMDRMKVCSCKTCVNDVLALALNTLPTKYVTTSAGKQLFQRDSYKKEYETDILAALTKACVRVKASPRH